MTGFELPLKLEGEDKQVLTSMSQLLFSARWVWKEVIINRNGKIILPEIISAEIDPKWGDTTVYYRYSLPPGKYIKYVVRIEMLPKLSLYLDVIYVRVRFDEVLNAFVHDILAYYECIRDGKVVCNLKDLPKPIRKAIRMNALNLPFSYQLM